MGFDAIEPVVSEYEQQRAARIAANKQRLEALGVLEAANELRRPGKLKKTRCKVDSEPIVATRASKRVRGHAADAVPDNQVCCTGRGCVDGTQCCSTAIDVNLYYSGNCYRILERSAADHVMDMPCTDAWVSPICL